MILDNKDIERILETSAAAVLDQVRETYAEWAEWAAPLIVDAAGAAMAADPEACRRLDHLLAQAEAKAATLQIAAESHAAMALRAVVATAVRALVAMA